jgi:hypothetical protein
LKSGDTGEIIINVDESYVNLIKYIDLILDLAMYYPA